MKLSGTVCEWGTCAPFYLQTMVDVILVVLPRTGLRCSKVPFRFPPCSHFLHSAFHHSCPLFLLQIIDSW